jgi:hypothetical protein
MNSRPKTAFSAKAGGARLQKSDSSTIALTGFFILSRF